MHRRLQPHDCVAGGRPAVTDVGYALEVGVWCSRTADEQVRERPDRRLLVVSITLDAVIADDDPVVRARLRVFVEADTDLEVVREAADGAEAVAVPRSVQPDVVLMEVPMPISTASRRPQP